ncbi:MAG: cobyrinate a,c-diamide synthase, partial [Lentisphaerae bacterium]|nr:cobyrinate a,c-diamide synthase [Lentisphaerota bacterium]
IIGVISNNVSSERHADILKHSLKIDRLPPLLGWIPRDEKLKLPERHLGLVPVFENKKKEKWFDKLADICEKHVDIKRILKSSVVSHQSSLVGKEKTRIKFPDRRLPAVDRLPKIGIAYDNAFNFYYEDNFDALRDAGFEIVFFSPLKDKKLPEGIKFLYIGGGFPEVFAKRLSANKSMLKSVADFAEAGGNVFAECGGFMYLSENIFCGRRKYKMCGVLPCRIKMGSKLHSLGYREIKLMHSSFLGKKGTVLRGHEFHWSAAEFTSKNIIPAFEVRGTRKDSKWTPTGIRVNNVIASYIHVHFLSNTSIPKKHQEY